MEIEEKDYIVVYDKRKSMSEEGSVVAKGQITKVRENEKFPNAIEIDLETGYRIRVAKKKK